MKRFSIILLWVVVLLGGAVGKFYWQSRQQRPSPKWKTARSLPLNHQMRKDDLKKPDDLDRDSLLPPLEEIIGRYLSSEKNPEALIEAKDISLMPVVNSLGKDYAALFYTLDSVELPLADLLDAGGKIRLCAALGDTAAAGAKTPQTNASECSKAELEIIAIHRKTSESGEDWLLLKVPAEEAKELGKIMAAKKRLLLITALPPVTLPSVADKTP
jgi:hypothetical protein